MRNRYKPFFYEKKRTPFKTVILIILAAALILIYTGLQIPRVSQVIAQPLYAAWSFTRNTAKDFFDATRRYREPEQKPQTYDPLELPDRQVLFAESLESLSSIQQEDPLADLRQTPTVSEYAKVAEWEYQDPNLNYAIRANDSPVITDSSVALIPSVFERADLNNDGAAILSALLRYRGIIENQYHIAQTVHPNRQDPVTSFADLQHYVTANYPDLSVITRINGDKDILISLLQQGIPVLIRMQYRSPYLSWLQDDRLCSKYVIIYGYDSQTDSFSCQDTQKSNELRISAGELMANWYPYQRKYMVLFPADETESVQSALSENYFEELNLQRAEVKFRTDSEMLPDNPYAQANYSLALHLIGDEQGAWDYLQKAVELKLPQRWLSENPDILYAGLSLGLADEMDALIDPVLRRMPYDEELLTYRGWTSILRGDISKGTESLEKAEKINPNNETVQYAVKYIETMI